MPMRLLLLSNSRDPRGEFLTWALDHIRDFFGGARSALFVPYAAVSNTFDGYAEYAASPFASLGMTLRPVHREPDPARAVRDAEAIVVGGGNTFHLLRELYATRLLDPIRERVGAGVPYLGWSAGAVIAAPTIRTTNDMPIIEPPSLAALGLVPFQINAHYTDFHPPGFQGETRAERLTEFLAVNPEVRVIGLREGTMLRVEGDDVALLGSPSAVIFEHRRPPREVTPGEPLAELMA